MLVLSRKLGEELLLGDNVRLTIVSIQGKSVRIGLTAPADVPIHRTGRPGKGERAAEPPATEGGS